MVAVIALILLVVPTVSHATTYWVSPSGSATLCTQIDGDTDPGAYMTPSAIDAANCAAAGDTVVWKAGTYTGSRVLFTDVLPSGTSSSVVSTHLCETDRGCIIAFSSVTGGTGVIQTANAQYYQIGRVGNGFVADCVNGGGQCGGVRLQLSGSIIATGVVVENILVRNHHATGFNMSESQPTNYYDGVIFRYVETEYPASPAYTGDGDPHPMYVKGSNITVEHSTFRPFSGLTSSYTIHGWHNVRGARVRYNYIEGSQAGKGITLADSETYPTNADNWIYNNTFTCPALNCGIAIRFYSNNRANGSRAYNNTIYGFATQLENQTGNNNSHYVNNVCAGGACAITNNGTNLTCGGTCSTTNPTVTASSHFRDAANGDFSLISGSSLIDAGINVSLSYNGTLPDIGAYETFAPSAATVNTNQLDITISMNSLSPLQLLSGTTGWSIGCTGTGCGTPTVSAANIVSGSSTIVRLTISGITGTDCAIGQTWTWSYNGTTGNVQDQAKIGGSTGQRLFTYSSQAVTNSCTGTSTSYPGGYHLWYQLDDGSSGTTPTSANDESANNLDGTLTGSATWNAMGKASNSVTLTPDSGQYVAIPYGSGVNPSTQSLTIAFWVKVTAGRETLNKGYFGASLGTNQRFFISTRDSTWKLGIQSSTDSSANGTSDLSVEPGVWTHLCLVMDSTTDTATLYKNGVAGTAAGVVKSYTSFTFASNFELGRIGGIATGGGADFDDLIIYQSVQDCNALYRVREPETSGSAGTFTQVAHRFGLVHQSPAGAWQTYGLLNTTGVSVVRGGGCSLVTQIDCTGSDCDAIGVRYYYSRNGGTWQLVPDTMTSDEVEFWGSSSTQYVFTGAADRLSGALTETKGQTHLTSAAETFDIAQNGSFTWRGVFRFGSTATGTYCFKSYNQDGSALGGGYSPSSGACLTIVNPMGGGVGF